MSKGGNTAATKRAWKLRKSNFFPIDIKLVSVTRLLIGPLFGTYRWKSSFESLGQCLYVNVTFASMSLKLTRSTFSPVQWSIKLKGLHLISDLEHVSELGMKLQFLEVKFCLKA